MPSQDQLNIDGADFRKPKTGAAGVNRTTISAISGMQNYLRATIMEMVCSL
jgi:hypothetical protein